MPDRMKHVEAAVQALQRSVGRIGHRAGEDGLFDQRLERLDRKIRGVELGHLRREVFGSQAPPRGEWEPRSNRSSVHPIAGPVWL